MKKLLSSILVITMMLSLFIVGAVEVFAADENVAELNGTKYASFAKAIAAANAAEGGATVTLLSDVTMDENLTISGNVTIKGKYTITRAHTGTLFEVSAGATLTLDGGLVVDGGNAWTYTKTPLEMDMANGAGTKVANHITPAEGGVNATASLIVNNGTLNANKVTIQNSYSTSNVVRGINCGASSVTTINGAILKNIAANSSGAVLYVGGADATLTIKGDTRITGNFGVGNGGIIQNYGQGTTVNLEDGSIDNNHVGSSGTVYASYSGNANKINTFNMSGGFITKNIMEGYGPVYIHTNTVWNMTGGEISENTSFLPSYVRSNNNAATISGGKIVNNNITGEDYSNGYYVTRTDIFLSKNSKVTGGTFTQDVSEYCTDGFKVEQNSDGTYGVEEDPIHGKVAKVGDNYYATLADAIKDATAGQTIIFLDDINENVTIDKNLTIDGANFKYTGTLNIGTVTNVTIKNVNFVKGSIDGNTSQTQRNLTVTNCTFDGVDKSIGYAITVRHGASVKIENSTAKNYNTGMLYVPQSVVAITVKDVTVENVTVAFNITYSGDALFEEVTLNNVTYGIHFQIYGSRTYTVKNCDLKGATNPFWFWDRSNNTAKVTVVFEGNNDLGNKSITVNAGALKMAAGANLTAAEGLTITTDVEDCEVEYENGVYSVVDAVGVAQIGNTKYKTLADAIADAKNGDTIILLTDCSEDVTVVQAPDVDITIDGNKNTMTGTITVNGKSAAYATAGLTIKNFNFDASNITKEASINLGGNNNIRYTSNVTVENCTFTGNYPTTEKSGIKNYTGGCKNLTVTGCTATYMHSLIQVKGVEGLTVSGVVVTDCKNGISVGTSTNVSIKDSKIEVTGYGFRADGDGAYTATVKDCTIKAELPIVVRKAKAAYELTLAGVNTLTGTNANGYAVIFTAGDDGSYEEPTGSFVFTNNGNEVKVYPTAAYVAQVGDKYYESIEKALTAAKNGDTVKLLAKVELPSGYLFAQNATFTINLNGFELSNKIATAYYNTTVRFVGKGKLNVSDRFVLSSNTKVYFDPSVEFNGMFQFNKTNAYVYVDGKCWFSGEDVSIFNYEGSGSGRIKFAIADNAKTVVLKSGVFNLNDNASLDATNITVEKSATVNIPVNTVLTINPKATLTVNGTVQGEGAIAVGTYAHFDAVLTKTSIKNIILTDSILIENDITLDLTGKNVVTAETAAGKYVDAFTILANVTVKGGIVDARPSHGFAFYVGDKNGNAGNLTIESGDFYGETSVVNNRLGTVTINGGYFEVSLEHADDRYAYVLNCIDANYNNGTAKFVITGGTFANFNPQDNAAEGAGTNFLAKEYGVTVEDNKYTVVGAVAYIGTKGYVTLNDALAAAKDGETVTLAKNINVGWDDAVKTSDNYPILFKVEGKSITLDLKGTITVDHLSTTDRIYAVVFVADGASLTVTGNGGIDVNVDNNTPKVAYMFWKRGSTGTLTIESGNYHMNNSEDSMVYTNGNEIVAIKGGNFTLDEVGTRANGFPCIFNAQGNNTQHINVSGGTYNYNVADQYWAHEVNIVDADGNLSYVIDNKNGTWTVTGLTAEVAIMKDVQGPYDYPVGYATFKDAVASIAKGAPETTIVLQKNITVKGQFIGHSYAQKVVIDLNSFKMSSTDKALTVYRGGTTVLIKNGTVHGNTSGGTIQVTYGGKLTLGENVTITCGGSANAIKVDANSTLIIAEKTAQVLGGKADIVVADGATVKLSAGTYKHDVKAEWLVEGYISVKNTDGTYSVVKDPAYGMAACIGDNYFETLAEAIKAAQDGNIITLVNDVNVDADDLDDLDGNYTFFKVEGKSITIDLNGKNIVADVSANTIDKFILGVFSTTNNGHLTLTGNGTVKGISGETQEDAYLDPAKGNKDYNYKFYTLLVSYDEGCWITINGGNYVLDFSGDSLIYSSNNEGVVVNGGTFTLGNLGGIRNGMPWVFNARGQNVRHVLVNGGSFCSDIQHQYYPFEVQMSKEKALKLEDAMYTVVDAVAYVTEREWSSAWYTNEVGYATLEEAIAACEGAKTKTIGKKTYTSEAEVVVLLETITLEDTLTIAAGKTVTIDLNGYTISQTKNCTASYAMIANNGNLTIKDSSEEKTGKIILTDTGAGDPNFGWGSYTIRNEGTLVVEGGTIKFVGNQAFGTHCSLAIFQYSGSTTINGGNIINNSYRSVRLWSGEMTINGGTFEGQVWVHCVDDSAKLTITGGSFAPAMNGGDGSSVFVNNYGYKAELSITGGYFATKVGANDANAIAGCITGGNFTDSAKNNTDPKLFA